ncbi:hypothetical protein [Alicyclobacillus fodiniaquatilis]|uniref:Uncharacterized protein n=1 Tax=Alicyclobacillus fodiniaquatilis TaxID=1661150 RepID=A0ABW4JG74_9BACL
MLRASIGFVAWYLVKRHAMFGAEMGNGIRLSIFSQTKIGIET